MDGFSLACHICSCTDEPISYHGISKALIGPYFPNETLTVAEFLRFKLPSFQTNLQTPACLSHCPLSIKELTEHELRSMPCPPCPVVKALISQYDPDHANPLHSIKIGIHYTPINVLHVWEILFQVQNVQRFWKESGRLVEAWANYHSADHIAIMAAQKRLLSCNWNTKVLGFSKSALSTVGGLMHHLTFSCLVTTDISYHVELLARALEASDIRARLLSPLDIQYLTGCAT
jgi:hypothetical protein